MKYAQTATPIHTLADLDAAVAAGASVEFTACANAYDVPPHYKAGSLGWVPAGRARRLRNSLPGARAPDKDLCEFKSGQYRLRAFYSA